MSRNDIISNRLREVLLNGHWIANTNYKEQLLNVDWKQATQKVGNLNTIAQLIYHINYYIEGLLQVFNGGELKIRDKYSFDLPPIQSENDWELLVTTLLTNSEAFANTGQSMPDTKFDEVVVDAKYGTYLRNIEGIIEHSYYHLGQISLIKKLTSGTGS
ncbi:MAG: DinB family protein [Sphingobacteriales bacterium]